MFYRRKLILAILEIFGGKLEKINLQKILFLVCKKQEKPEYDFIPYLFGCYSFSAKADLNTMVPRGILQEDETCFYLNGKTNYSAAIKAEDFKIVTQAFMNFKGMDRDSLMKYTYINHPYYAINSTTAERLLSKKQLEMVSASKHTSNDTVLFTIGYEGISLEAYLNKLIINNH